MIYVSTADVPISFSLGRHHYDVGVGEECTVPDELDYAVSKMGLPLKLVEGQEPSPASPAPQNLAQAVIRAFNGEWDGHPQPGATQDEIKALQIAGSAKRAFQALQGQLSDRDEHIAAQDEEATELRAKVAEHEQTIAAQKTEIEAHKAEVESHKAMLESLTKPAESVGETAQSEAAEAPVDAGKKSKK